MAIYKHNGSIVVLNAGRCLTNLTVNTLTIENTNLKTEGILAYREFGTPHEIRWQAATEVIGGEIGQWRLRKQNGEMIASGPTNTALEGFITGILNTLAREHPQVVTKSASSETNGSKEPALTPEPPPDTSFPKNWAGRAIPNIPTRRKYKPRTKEGHSATGKRKENCAETESDDSPPRRNPIDEATESVQAHHYSGSAARDALPKHNPPSTNHEEEVEEEVERPNKHRKSHAADEGTAPARALQYQGPKVTYQGSCVCEQVAESSSRTPFDWHALTEGKFPARCFECSCGRHWWQNWPNEVFWVEVLDEDAWILLTQYSGVLVTSMAHTPDGVYLLETLLRTGDDNYTVQRP